MKVAPLPVRGRQLMAQSIEQASLPVLICDRHQLNSGFDTKPMELHMKLLVFKNRELGT